MYVSPLYWFLANPILSIPLIVFLLVVAFGGKPSTTTNWVTRILQRLRRWIAVVLTWWALRCWGWGRALGSRLVRPRRRRWNMLAGSFTAIIFVVPLAVLALAGWGLAILYSSAPTTAFILLLVALALALVVLLAASARVTSRVSTATPPIHNGSRFIVRWLWWWPVALAMLSWRGGRGAAAWALPTRPRVAAALGVVITGLMAALVVPAIVLAGYAALLLGTAFPWIVWVALGALVLALVLRSAAIETRLRAVGPHIHSTARSIRHWSWRWMGWWTPRSWNWGSRGATWFLTRRRIRGLVGGMLGVLFNLLSALLLAYVLIAPDVWMNVPPPSATPAKAPAPTGAPGAVVDTSATVTKVGATVPVIAPPAPIVPVPTDDQIVQWALAKVRTGESVKIVMAPPFKFSDADLASAVTKINAGGKWTASLEEQPAALYLVLRAK